MISSENHFGLQRWCGYRKLRILCVCHCDLQAVFCYKKQNLDKNYNSQKKERNVSISVCRIEHCRTYFGWDFANSPTSALKRRIVFLSTNLQIPVAILHKQRSLARLKHRKTDENCNLYVWTEKNDVQRLYYNLKLKWCCTKRERDFSLSEKNVRSRLMRILKWSWYHLKFKPFGSKCGGAQARCERDETTVYMKMKLSAFGKRIPGSFETAA